jgi:hypothetical protein
MSAFVAVERVGRQVFFAGQYPQLLRCRVTPDSAQALAARAIARSGVVEIDFSLKLYGTALAAARIKSLTHFDARSTQ